MLIKKKFPPLWEGTSYHLLNLDVTQFFTMSQFRVANTPNENPAQILYPNDQRIRPAINPKMPSTPFETNHSLTKETIFLINSISFFITCVY